MVGAAQLCGARALIGIGRGQLAMQSGLPVQTIVRMETSGNIVRGNVDSLTRQLV